MLSIQKNIQFEGDLSKTETKEVNIEFSIPGYSYKLTGELNTPIRTPLNSELKYMMYNHKLGDTSYQAILPLSYFITKDNESFDAFLAFYQSDVPKKEMISFEISVSFYASADNSLVGRTSLDAYLVLGAIDLILLEMNKSDNSDSTDKIKEFLKGNLEEACFLLNKVNIERLMASVANSGFSEFVPYMPLIISALLAQHKKNNTKADAKALNKIAIQLNQFYKLDKKLLLTFLTYLAKEIPDMTDFPLVIPDIKTIEVKGTLTIHPPQDVALTKNDFARYGIEMLYQVKDGKQISPVVKHIDWENSSAQIKNNAITFSFTKEAPLIVSNIAGKIMVSLKSEVGEEIFMNEFNPTDPRLKNLNLEATLSGSNTASTGAVTTQDKNKRLRGQVFDISKKCHVKDAIVVIQAKSEGDTDWRIVGNTHTDAAGNFSMPYPFGNYVAAQAIVSLMPDKPVTISIHPENKNQTIADDFLYLMLKDADCNHPEEEDCDCHSKKKASRLPEQSDLINSDEYTQDIGGSCINLSTPNRTLSEFNYKAIVRLSDPDVANYTLNRNDHDFELNSNGTKISRKPVDIDNPIRWQDTPDKGANTSLYQAVTVATGHVLHYKSTFKADGYSLGELLYSLGLAPGQKKQVVVFDASHKLLGSESQTISQRERVAADLQSERDIISQLGGNISESMNGSSSASTSGVSGGLGVGAIMGPVGAVLGVAGGFANSNSSASQNSSRNISQFFSDKLKQSITQNADSYRELNASVVSTVGENQTYSATTEVVSNHNHCHAVTMMYFEVLRHYAIYQELASVEECVFVPLLMTNFTEENIYKWRNELAGNLLPVPSQTYLPKSIFSYFKAHPLLKGFDAIERIKTNYADVDFPTGSYDEETISYFKGEMQLRVNLPRPKSRYDRIKSLPIISKTNSHTEGFLGGGAAGAAGGATIGAVTGLVIGSLVMPGLGSVIGAIAGGIIGGSAGSQQTTVIDSVELVKQQIFDAFMQLDANYQSVPPAQCIRIKTFKPVSIPTIAGLTINVGGGDFFEGGINDKNQWKGYAELLGYGSTDDGILNMLDYYFKGRLIAEWDDIFYNDMLPVIFKKMVDSIRFGDLPFDLSTTENYRGNERVIRVNINGASPGKARRDFPATLTLSINNGIVKTLLPYVLFNVERLRILYSTPHYNGVLYNGYVGDDLLDDTLLQIPISADEKRNPRKEDVYLRNKLIEHLNSNIEHYNKVLWYRLDPDRRFMLLDGFNIPVYNQSGVLMGKRSLSSVVKNELISVTGNSLVFPVAGGYRVGRSFIQEVTVDNETTEIDLLDYYKPITALEPYRISIPSKGVFVEAVQGACDACEKVKENTSQDWAKFTTDEPTPIGQVIPPTPEVTDWKAAFKDFAQPIVNIQNAPASPAPGVGLTGLSDALTKSGVFKDITGLEGNQRNVMETYKSNQENAKAFAEMAKTMAMQGHNTTNSQKIMDALTTAKESGALNQEEYNKLVKEHLQQQIDGGESKKAEIDKEKAAAPSLTKAAVKAADEGKSVKAQKTDKEGNSEFIEINAGEEENTSGNILAQVSGKILGIKQENAKACWATAATMLVSWKQNKVLSVREVLAMAGDEYVTKLENGEGLKSAEKELFINRLEMMGEEPMSYSLDNYIEWLKKYGPLWVTTDSASATGKFSPHARILFKITGTGTPDGKGTYFEFLNPATGLAEKQSFLDFVKAFEQMVTDNSSETLFIQVVHFVDEIAGEEEEEEGEEDVTNSLSIDKDFIHELENPDGLKTPTVPDNNSGVTIADGYDLGQHNSADFKSLKLGADLEEKLKPYLLLKGQAARDKITELPLELSDDEINLINEKVFVKYSKELAARYDKIPGVKFSEFPAWAQTVIYSVYLQFGTKTPHFTGYATKQQWMNVVNELYNFKDKFDTRRKKEANYMLQNMLPGIDEIDLLKFNKFYAAKILDAVSDETIWINESETKTQLQSIKDGNTVVAGAFSIDPAKKMVKILPIISHFIDSIREENKPEQDRINAITDATLKATALKALKEKEWNRIVVGSFIRQDNPIKGGHHGHCIDINVLDTTTNTSNVSFADPIAMDTVIYILKTIQGLPSVYKSEFGFGLPYQGDFVTPGKGVKKEHVDAIHIKNVVLRLLLQEITNNIFPDNDNHLHIQAN